MTRKDFELIAHVLRTSPHLRALDELAAEVRDSLAQEFANALANTNERFDRAKFLKACQP
jgi:ABC-type branched-subunit amino acid transport system ATPase component